MEENNNDNNNVRFRDIKTFDEQLKSTVVGLITEAIRLNADGKLRKAFETFKSVRSFIVGYEYPNKDELDELEEILTNYFENLKNNTVFNRKDLIMTRNKNEYELNKLLDIFMKEIFKAYIELELWFSTVKQKKDYDKTLSEENFNSEYTGIKEKEQELASLNSEELLNLLTINQKHAIYSKFLFIKMMKGTGDDDV